MNYYIQGDAAKADQIKAAFESKGYDISWPEGCVNPDVINIGVERNGAKYVVAETAEYIKDIIKTHPNYQELQLPVGPNFKVGNWVVKKDGDTFYGGNYVEQITLIEVDEEGKRIWLSSKTWTDNDDIRLWSIADIKDGDVLMTTSVRNCPFIYRKTSHNNDLAYYYAGVDGNGDFCEGCLKRTSYHFGPVEDVVPATKEQRDLLFAKMKEAGYEWDEKKKELCKIIKPKFKVGDDIKTGNTIETIAEVDLTTRSYCCESGRTIWFENQDLWHLAPKPHYDIANFNPFDKVLVRDNDRGKWRASIFSYHIKGR